jgi:predicted nucleic acid-binding protein
VRKPYTGALVLDSEGVHKGATDDRRTLAILTKAIKNHRQVVVSTVTLAEVLRGHGRDARVHRLLKSCQVQPVSAEIGRAAGELLGRANRKDTVDAIVVATAAAQPYPSVIVTSDPHDLESLTSGFKDIGVAVV